MTDYNKNWNNLKRSGYSNEHLYIKTSGSKGIGVFSKKELKSGEVIEYCHSMVFQFRENYHKDPVIFQYAYPGDDEISDEWTNHGRKFLLPLGFGAIYNSADCENNSNCIFKTFTNEKLIVFYAKKDIKKDDEILVWWSQAYYDHFCK